MLRQGDRVADRLILRAAGDGDRLVEDGQALAAAMAFAERIASQPPLPVRMSKTTINRFDYNLKWNTMIETGGAVVGPDVKVTIDLELTKK